MSAPLPVNDRDDQRSGVDKLRTRLGDLRFVGEFSEADATARSLRLIETSHGAEHASDHIRLMLLIDEAGVVRDARYRTLAVGAQLAAYDVMVGLCLGRALADCAKITPDDVDVALRDDPAVPVLHLGGERDRPYYILVKAAERLHGPGTSPGAPAPAAVGSRASELAWDQVGLFEKVRRIEAVLDQHVRSALASDGGGIDLVDLKGNDLYVQYHGACGSCSSSIGGTLHFIQDSLNNHLATTLTVKVTGIEGESDSAPVIGV